MNARDRALGMRRFITRRDFLGATLVGSGAALLRGNSALAASAPAPSSWAKDWYGYGGVGDYASSHGNTPEVVQSAHDLRDGLLQSRFKGAVDTGETYDLIVVGGGFAGLGSARAFRKARGAKGTCLILENHPIFGGEAKQNEFVVDGHRLIGPQGSNGFIVPQAGFAASDGKESWRAGTRAILAELFTEFGIPSDFEYRPWEGKKPLRFAFDSYGPMLWTDEETSVGTFFDQLSHGVDPRMVVDLFQGKLDQAPLPERVRRDLERWRTTDEKPYAGSDVDSWLDSMSYKDYLEKTLRLGPEVTAYADPIVASALGLGCDVTSAYAAFHILLPGVKALAPAGAKYPTLHSFPGGNVGFARYLLKGLVPEALAGDGSFGAVMDGAVNWRALDRRHQPTRVRLGATAVRVEHEGGRRDRVVVHYLEGGRLYRARARGVVMATGSWITRHVVGGLSEEHRRSYDAFVHAPILVANVALKQWRFMHDMGVTAARWDKGFGFFCNIRRPMMYGTHRPPLDPDKPIVLTFYVPFVRPGKPASEQAKEGRVELLTTTFADYERQIREQLVRLFGASGFDPGRDVVGIILNRWGHAYVCPQPGFHFGRDGRKALRDVARETFGRIAFAHSEFEGHQNFPGALANAARAVHELEALPGAF